MEPNTEFADVLDQKLKETHLDRIYTPIFCGIEDAEQLAKHGIVPESLDCVLCVQVLCCVADPKAVSRQLYQLLKPGGELIFWEHQRNRDVLTRVVQCKFSVSFSQGCFTLSGFCVSWALCNVYLQGHD